MPTAGMEGANGLDAACDANASPGKKKESRRELRPDSVCLKAQRLIQINGNLVLTYLSVAVLNQICVY